LEYYKLYINGKWVDSSDGQTFVTQNPATGEDVNRFAQATPADVDNACAAAREAFQSGVWSGLNPDQRAEILCGGKRVDAGDCKNGNFYEPTILTNVTPDMECFQKEIFGPVLVFTHAGR
jgi:acyl-CoA reductase-like NAD-dependent aldehyde dehydrogenase